MDGKVLREVSQFPSGGNWTWQWLKDYVYRDSSLLAAVAAGPNNTTVTTHFHLDHLGTPRLITSDTGARLAQHTYLPFGGEAPGSDHDYEKMKFTGAERDAGATGDGTSLDYMHARFYSSSMARFLSVDPALDIERLLKTPHAWNPFVYASNNPLSRRDPDGRRDLYFAIWASRFPFFGNGSVGHVTVLEMDGRTVSSPFPTPHGWRGQYTNLSYIDTINQKEHRMPDFLYKVHVPNDAKFDAVIAEKTKADTWIALPLSRHSTNCVDTPTDALNAGGVPVSSPTNPILTPEGLAFALDSLESQQNPPVYGSGPFPPARVRGEDDWSVEQIHPHLDDTPPE
jgi:RHS repeat-associated protein